MVIRHTIYSIFIVIYIIICKNTIYITESNIIANTQQKMKKNKLYLNLIGGPVKKYKKFKIDFFPEKGNVVLYICGSLYFVSKV